MSQQVKLKFALWLEQTGGGCDYTIGCGQKLVWLNADTVEEARSASRKYFDPEYSSRDYEAAAILCFVEDGYPIFQKVREEWRETLRLSQEEKKNEQERAEFERLKKKFGGA